MTPDPRVDKYLDGLPADQRELLQALRQRIAKLAPDAIETISYDMPTFKMGKHFLLSYAGWKRHCSIYPITDDVLRKHEAALQGYGRTKGSLHFSEAQPLPDAVIDDLVRERLATLAAGAG